MYTWMQILFFVAQFSVVSNFCVGNMESTVRQNYGLISGKDCDHTVFNTSFDNSTLLSSEKLFVKPGPLVYYSIGSLMACVMIVGFTANLSVLYAYAKVRQIRTTDNTLVIGLALSDFGQSILGIPFVVIACFTREWIFGHGLCQYYAFITTSLGLAQITTLTLIATERYFIIVKHNRRLSNTQRKGATVIACSFLYGSAWATGPLLGWSNYKEEEIGIACCVTWEVTNSMALSYTISLCTIGWLLPLTLIAYGYISIARLIRSEKAKQQCVRSASFINKRTRRERKVAITILLMIGAFVVSWLPYSIVSLWSAVGDFKSIPLGVQVAPAIFAKCSVIWNPMIYVARHKHFRTGVKQSVPCLNALSKNRSLHSDTNQNKHVTYEQPRNLSVPENKEIVAANFSDSSSEIATINKASVACSTYKTSSVWVGTPSSVQRDCNMEDDQSSSEAESSFFDNILSKPNMLQTIGTQTETPSPLRVSSKQYLPAGISTKQFSHTDNYIDDSVSDSLVEVTRNKSLSTVVNSSGNMINKFDMENTRTEQEQVIGQTNYFQLRSGTELYDELHAVRVNSGRYIRKTKQSPIGLFKGNIQFADHLNHPLIYMKEHQNCNYVRNKSLYRIASEPANGSEPNPLYIELSDIQGRRQIDDTFTSCIVDNEHSQLIQTTL